MSPDTPDVTSQNASAEANASADANAIEGTMPAVKKPRAPRKTVVKTEAAVDEARASPAPPLGRSRDFH